MFSSEHWSWSQDPPVPRYLGHALFYPNSWKFPKHINLKDCKNSNLFYFNSVFPKLIHLTNESLFGSEEIEGDIAPINTPQT